MFSTDVKILPTLPARLAAFAPKLTVLLSETGDYARTMQFLSPYERTLVRRIRSDFAAGRSNVYTKVTRREAPTVEGLLVNPPKAEPVMPRDPDDEQRGPAGEFIVTALERFKTGERFLRMDSATLTERRITLFVDRLPRGTGAVDTVGGAVKRISSLCTSTYKEARQMAAKEAGRLIDALEEVVHVSARMPCPVEITRATALEMMREKARAMKAHGISTPRIARKVGRSDAWVQQVTADVPGVASRNRNERPLWEGLEEWVTKGTQRLKLAIRESDLDFAAGMDAAMIVLGTLSKGSGHLQLESRDVARLSLALDWLEAETALEREMGVIRLRVRNSLLANDEAKRAAAAGLRMAVSQIKSPMVFKGKSRASCDTSPTGVGVVIEFLDEDTHEMLAGLQAAKRALRQRIGITSITSLEDLITLPEWAEAAAAWAGNE